MTDVRTSLAMAISSGRPDRRHARLRAAEQSRNRRGAQQLPLRLHVEMHEREAGRHRGDPVPEEKRHIPVAGLPVGGGCDQVARRGPEPAPAKPASPPPAAAATPAPSPQPAPAAAAPKPATPATAAVPEPRSRGSEASAGQARCAPKTGRGRRTAGARASRCTAARRAPGPKLAPLQEARLVRDYCTVDFQVLCKGVQLGQGRAINCLASNQPRCRRVANRRWRRRRDKRRST